MKPLFTIHAGEFVVGDYIERKFRRVNIWVPTKDTGVDLLISGNKNKRVLSLQVKFSRDFPPTQMAAVCQKPLPACGWWSLNRQKIAASPADYWIFVLVGFARRSPDFVIITPAELLRRLDAIHHGNPKIFKATSGSRKRASAGKPAVLNAGISCSLQKASSRIMRSATSKIISTTGTPSKNSTGHEPMTSETSPHPRSTLS